MLLDFGFKKIEMLLMMILSDLKVVQYIDLYYNYYVA